ncbi:hypothetical protein [Nocardia wallacei]|uniref:hypothetical protein n=1 Tax=Nocardia wallacei TaxID=480035 RepID=UPI002456C536|nr:hypothetical protein [Nocardia wallacei]
MRICDHCAGRIPAGRSRIAKYCSAKCQQAAAKQRRQQGGRPALEAVAAPAADAPPEAKPSTDPLVGMVRQELMAAGRLETTLGQQALALAERMRGAGGSALAALSKELRTVMSEATRGASAAKDPIDELRLRRDRKSG